MSDPSISINKYISSRGICSRREADRWIEAGRVHINGQIAKKGNRVMPDDIVKLDGKPLAHTPKAIYILCHKPPGISSTTDQRDPDNIIDFIGYRERIFPIGRLDKASSGLIILTNNGDIVNKILRKENHHEKEYLVTVDKPVTDRFLQRMARGVPILGIKTLPCQIKVLGKKKFRIILTQGLNRQIRRMCEYFGYRVVTLKRTRIMDITLGELRPGQWQLAKGPDLADLERIAES